MAVCGDPLDEKRRAMMALHGPEDWAHIDVIGERPCSTISVPIYLESRGGRGLPILMLCSFGVTGVQGSRTRTRGRSGKLQLQALYAKKLHII